MAVKSFMIPAQGVYMVWIWPFKARLHFGKNRAKLIGFKEYKKIFSIENFLT
jgi:hypothetical protein